MESKLKSGTTLIIDRYSFSGVAFSSAKGLDVEWCKKAAERGGYGGERYEQLEFQKRVAQSYKMLCDATWKIVDATLPFEDVEKQLREIVTECMLKMPKGKPFTELCKISYLYCLE
ncbi:Thymidylate kinase [Sesamum angolense]|uniref:dTMP kinase n=1 Tax=Sesamum angolense TaxID=2727404 RepID=A0AAE2C5Q3_9LAMI|nr:Thymidylate kinase [Sesamum angolense]